MPLFLVYASEIKTERYHIIMLEVIDLLEGEGEREELWFLGGSVIFKVQNSIPEFYFIHSIS